MSHADLLKLYELQQQQIEILTKRNRGMTPSAASCGGGGGGAKKPVAKKPSATHKASSLPNLGDVTSWLSEELGSEKATVAELFRRTSEYCKTRKGCDGFKRRKDFQHAFEITFGKFLRKQCPSLVSDPLSLFVPVGAEEVEKEGLAKMDVTELAAYFKARGNKSEPAPVVAKSAVAVAPAPAGTKMSFAAVASAAAASGVVGRKMVKPTIVPASGSKLKPKPKPSGGGGSGKKSPWVTKCSQKLKAQYRRDAVTVAKKKDDSAKQRMPVGMVPVGASASVHRSANSAWTMPARTRAPAAPAPATWVDPSATVQDRKLKALLKSVENDISRFLHLRASDEKRDRLLLRVPDRMHQLMVRVRDKEFAESLEKTSGKRRREKMKRDALSRLPDETRRLVEECEVQIMRRNLMIEVRESGKLLSDKVVDDAKTGCMPTQEEIDNDFARTAHVFGDFVATEMKHPKHAVKLAEARRAVEYAGKGAKEGATKHLKNLEEKITRAALADVRRVHAVSLCRIRKEILDGWNRSVEEYQNTYHAVMESFGLDADSSKEEKKAAKEAAEKAAAHFRVNAEFVQAVHAWRENRK